MGQDSAYVIETQTIMKALKYPTLGSETKLIIDSNIVSNWLSTKLTLDCDQLA